MKTVSQQDLFTLKIALKQKHIMEMHRVIHRKVLTAGYNFLLTLPSYLSIVENTILFIDRFKPIPIASEATKTS